MLRNELQLGSCIQQLIVALVCVQHLCRHPHTTCCVRVLTSIYPVFAVCKNEDTVSDQKLDGGKAWKRDYSKVHFVPKTVTIYALFPKTM